MMAPSLRELRNSRCLSVFDISKAVGVSENTVYRWERGELVPTLEPAMKLARYFGLTVEDINWWPLREE